MSDFPRTTVGGVSLSRLIVGTNWFRGYSHTSAAKDRFIKSFQSRQNIADILAVFFQAGVDAVMGMPDPMLCEAISDAEDRTGRKATLIVTPDFNLLPGGPPENDPEPVFDRCRKLGGAFCFPHQCVTDALVDRRQEVIRDLDTYTRMIRERGMIPGLSTHMPETVVIADKTGVDVETYIQLYNAAGFLMQVEADWVMRVITHAKKPVMTIKPLAAGRLLPVVGLAFVWSTIRDQDMVTIGTTTPDEAREVIDLSLDLLNRRLPENELQKTRSKRALVPPRDVSAVTTAARVPESRVEPRPTAPRLPESPWSAVRGFNYQPSYGTTGLELWLKFDAATIEAELSRGKTFFPAMNALRWWQSRDAFLRDPDRYAKNFDTTLDLAAKVGCRVIPCLFNRWHDTVLDYGGIYLDHFVPQASWVQTPGMFDAFLGVLVGRHKDDPRILAWDLCNEPFYYTFGGAQIGELAQNETAWLMGLRDRCKTLGARAPITVGCHTVMPLERIEPVCDLLSIHPYFFSNRLGCTREAYEKGLDRQVEFALKAGKPLLATECCWGAIDDAVRVENIRYELSQCKRRNIGWLVYVLHHSLVADAHRPEFGALTDPGNLAFIEADGSLRPGHAVFNEF
jgi:hypothetical protein